MNNEITDIKSTSLRESGDPPTRKSERVDSDYDGLWTEELLLWILAWIDVVKAK